MNLATQGGNAAEVLVIDDVEEIVEELLGLLVLLDIPAVGAHSLDQAMRILHGHPTIRVIACDVRLKRESGLEIIDLVHADSGLSGRDLRYIFMTGDSMQSDAIRAHPVLAKPVQPRELVRLLKAMLGRGDEA